MLIKAALLKESIEKVKANPTPNATDLQLQEKNIDCFELRCFNSLSEREVSSPQVTSSLLQLPTHYTDNYNFVQVNLWWLRKYVCMAIDSFESLYRSSSESIGEEQCLFDHGEKSLVSRFDNYK